MIYMKANFGQRRSGSMVGNYGFGNVNERNDRLEQTVQLEILTTLENLNS